jgi:DNA-binding NtrC family response regulator
MLLSKVLGCSRAHRGIVDQIRRIADFDAEVLITGPTGVGKEVYARLVHASSARARGPFVPFNCGALPADLFENELFGHSASAYTGARSDGEGLAAAAQDGTLFLDEVDSLPLAGQVKLLRFVQFREYRRLGETRLRQSNARIIAATNCKLEAAVEAGRFRADLFYRLRVIPIEVPPLRERPDDVTVFFEAFGEFYAKAYDRPPIVLTNGARRAVACYDWPGNVREVENCVRYLTCLQLDRAVQEEDLPFTAKPGTPPVPQDLLSLPLRDAKKELIRRFEREYLSRALEANGGNITRAARASGKNRRAFFELMRQHGLNALGELQRAGAEPRFRVMKNGAGGGNGSL